MIRILGVTAGKICYSKLEVYDAILVSRKSV